MNEFMNEQILHVALIAFGMGLVSSILFGFFMWGIASVLNIFKKIV